MKCPMCGEPVEVGDNFCEGCGNELGQQSDVASSTQPPPQPEVESSRGNQHSDAAPGTRTTPQPEDEPSDAPGGLGWGIAAVLSVAAVSVFMVVEVNRQNQAMTAGTPAPAAEQAIPS